MTLTRPGGGSNSGCTSRRTQPLLRWFVSSEVRQEKCFQFQIQRKYKSKRRPSIVSMQSVPVIIIL